MQTTLSLVMIVKNESQVLERCLESVKSIVDEIVIVDTGSTDNTKEIALLYGAKVYDYEWRDDFSAARNFGLERATGNWRLILDADEHLDVGSGELIRDFIQSSKSIGAVRIKNKFLDGNEVRYSYSFASRILPKGVYYQGRIHEQVVSSLPRVRTPILVHHDGYYMTDKFDRNVGILRQVLKEQPSDPYILYQLAKEYMGKERFIEAVGYFDDAYHRIYRNEGYYPTLVTEYLYTLMKTGAWEKGLSVISKEEIKLHDYPDFHFAAGLFYMELIFSNVSKYGHLLSQIEKEFLTCVKIGDTKKYDSVEGTGSFLAYYNLGVYYEVKGEWEKARGYYEKAAQYHYLRAVERLKNN